MPRAISRCGLMYVVKSCKKMAEFTEVVHAPPSTETHDVVSSLSLAMVVAKSLSCRLHHTDSANSSAVSIAKAYADQDVHHMCVNYNR